MPTLPRLLSLLAIALGSLLAGQPPAQAQGAAARSSFLVPQARPWNRPPANGSVTLTAAEARVEVTGQVATTTLDFALTNAFATRLESELVIPVPEGAVLRGFEFQGLAKEPTAKLLTKEEARHTYDTIVAQMRDPALLEFIGCNLIRSSVFPVEPRAGQRVRVVYEQLLAADGSRVDYVLPRSESLDYQVPWKIQVTVHDSQAIATAYSPSHKVTTERLDERSLKIRLAHEACAEPGPFRLSWLRETREVTASLLAYPDARIGGGYFLLLAGTPVKTPVEQARQKREVILVLDRSGSMAGEKLEQAKAAALQLVESLEEGEAFNLIIFADTVESFAAAPVIKDAAVMKAARQFIKTLGTRGGTNLHDALAEALRTKPTPGMLPIVLFLTDGLPTVGQTSERVIRDLALKGNPHERRLFTFGVGTDVNTALLDKLAHSTRGSASFVLPGENVESKVGEVFARLRGPVLASPVVRVGDSRVHDLLPAPLPDLFEGDQLVVLGRYTGDAPLNFELEGRYFGQSRTFKFTFPLDKATIRNAFIPRLWASREIAHLDDAIRDLGVDGQAVTSDPRAKELIDEIVRLSKEFGILTPYTSFLANEGSELSAPALAAQVHQNYMDPVLARRYGLASVSQEVNRQRQGGQSYLNSQNTHYDAQMNRVSVTTVQQVANGSFYRRDNRWVDAAASERAKAVPDRTVEVGSAEFNRLVERLVKEGRQSCFAMRGELLLKVGDETVLVK
jgi:Ca-activated chloride channel family protein